MRSAKVVTGIVLLAMASGCGGGSDGAESRPVSESGSQGSATATPTAASDGQLGGAVVARPGSTKTKGGVEKITGKSILPPNVKNGVGAEENCTDVDVQPTPQNLAHVSDVIFCLMNAMRANAGLPLLRLQDQLTKASLLHAQDMAENKFFAHDSQDGRTVVDRLKGALYIPKSGQWVIGENLAWGAGALATPKALVNAWMNSQAHRENLLSGDFVEVGMGVAYGTPSDKADDGITVTTDFGTRPGSTAAGTATSGAQTVDLGDATNTVGGSGTGATASGKAAVAGQVAAKRKLAAKRKRALQRCSRKRGSSKRRCVRAARRIRR